MVKFKEIQTRLLPPPFATNCRNYTNSRYLIRNDCVIDCLINRIRDKCRTENESFCFYYYAKNGYLLRRDLFINENIRLFCQNECSFVNQIDIDFCDEFCPNNCIQTYYEFD